MQLPISEINTNIISYLAAFPSYRDILVKLSLLTVDASI